MFCRQRKAYRDRRVSCSIDNSNCRASPLCARRLWEESNGDAAQGRCRNGRTRPQVRRSCSSCIRCRYGRFEASDESKRAWTGGLKKGRMSQGRRTMSPSPSGCGLRYLVHVALVGEALTEKRRQRRGRRVHLTFILHCPATSSRATYSSNTARIVEGQTSTSRRIRAAPFIVVVALLVTE